MNAKRPLRILVVDDTVIFRKVVSDILDEMEDVEVVGVAHNGKIALSKIASLKPDLLTLDIEMPEMNGLEVLYHIRKQNLNVGSIMLSTLTRQGADMTMRALDLGAFDFISKPQGKNLEENKEIIKNTLAPMLKAFNRRIEIKEILASRPRDEEKSRMPIKTGAPPTNIVQRMQAITAGKAKSEIIAIGISTGGPNALATVMPAIPPELNVPILIVQHMPPVFTNSLAKSLNTKCKIEVKEALDGEQINPNVAYIAPGGKHMRVAAGADGKHRIIRISDDPPENSCKPSVDYLFRSVAHHFVGRTTGVIMTGMGSDGTESLKLMKKNGATIIAQNEATCVVYGMSKEPIEAGIADIIAPLNMIANEIIKTVKPFSN